MIHLVVLDSEFALSPSWTARYCLLAMRAAVCFRSIAIGLYGNLLGRSSRAEIALNSDPANSLSSTGDLRARKQSE